MSLYWKALCTICGWKGSSEKLDGGMPLADTGDYDDLYCPICRESEIIETGTLFIELSIFEILKLLFRIITFYGLRLKRKKDKEEIAYIKEMEEKYIKQLKEDN